MFQGPSQKLLNVFESITRSLGWIRDLQDSTLPQCGVGSQTFCLGSWAYIWPSRSNIVNVNFGNQQNPKILEVSVSVAEISVIRVHRVLCLWDAPLGRDAQYDPKLLDSLSVRTTQCGRYMRKDIALHKVWKYNK